MIQFLDAATTNTEGAGGMLGGFGGIIMMIGIFVVMYFLMIRPQKKEEKRTNEMRNSLMVGDEIVTIGGVIGRVCNIKEDIITLEINKDRTKLKVYRWAVRDIVNPMPRPTDADNTKPVANSDDAPELKD